MNAFLYELLDRERDRLGSYCKSKCGGLCCRKGFLIVEKRELDVISPNNQNDFKKLEGGKYSIDLNKSCPALKNELCTIHKNPNRPDTCRLFPLFLIDKKVVMSSRCPAVNDNFFFPLTYELKRLKIDYTIGRV